MKTDLPSDWFKMQGLIQGVDGVANHPPWALYSFIIFYQSCFQIQSQECKFSKFSWGICMPPDPLARACWVWYILCMQERPILSNPHFNSNATYDNVHDTGVKDPTSVWPWCYSGLAECQSTSIKCIQVSCDAD